MHRGCIFQKGICGSMITCNVVEIKIMLRLFQENKSYGIKTITLILCLHIATHHDITSQTLPDNDNVFKAMLLK